MDKLINDSTSAYTKANEYLEYLYNVAYDISHAAHKGQFDKGGEPYTSHVDTVCVNSVYHDSGNFIIAIVAQLHDVVEDTYIPLNFIESIFGKHPIGEAVDAITRRKDEMYMDYIKRCKQNDIARIVKIEDLKHNMQFDRIPNPTEADYRRVKKYKKALKILEDNNAGNEV